MIAKWYRIGLVALLLAGPFAFYAMSRGAQSPGLADRIAKLKAEINTAPTDTSNHQERMQTVRDWGDDLTARGRFLTQQDLNLTFLRLPEPSPQLDAAIKQWIKALSFLEEKGGQMGTLVRKDGNELIAGKNSTIVLEYTIGETEIQKGQGIRVGQNFFNNRVRLQVVDPVAESYVSFKVESKTAETESYVANFMGIYSNIFGPVPMPGLRVTSGALKQGDKVTITIGDTSRNSPGYRQATRDSGDLPFLISADFNGDGTIVPVARISTVVSGDDAAFINAVAPSIVSMHGSFEYFGQRYLRRGYRVGLVAASDDHTGHPGYSPAVVSTRNGLAAVYSPTLDRDGIWRGMKDRATYATSNARRPVVRMTVNDKHVGESIPSGSISGSGPIIKARVLGTSAIDHIDVIHNGQVEYRKDYLTPGPADPAAVQIMFHTQTETPGDVVASPRGGVGWGGWIEVSGGRIASIEPLNVDHHTDEFHQVDDRRIWFTCRTRGDFDGLLIRLAQAPADAQVRVIVSELMESAGGTGASGYVVRPPGPPSRKPLHEISFKISEVAQKQAEFNLKPNVNVYARKARANAPWDVSFSYRPAKAPAQDDYYYLRVVQIDGEVAWVSPVWIGEESSQKKR